MILAKTDRLRRGALEGLAALACLVGPSIIANVAAQSLFGGDAFMDLRNALRVAALVLGYAIWVRWRERRSLTEFGGAGALGESFVGLLIGAAMVTLAVAAMAVGGAYRVTAVRHWSDAVALLPLVVTLALLEEVLFRLILLRLLERWLGTGWALLLSSLLFGLAHLGMGPATVASTLLLGLEGGLLFGAAYLLTRRIWLCLGLHIGWNFVQMGVFSADATLALKRGGWLQADIHGPGWLTGGVHGMEASVPAVVLCLGTTDASAQRSTESQQFVLRGCSSTPPAKSRSSSRHLGARWNDAPGHEPPGAHAAAGGAGSAAKVAPDPSGACVTSLREASGPPLRDRTRRRRASATCSRRRAMPCSAEARRPRQRPRPCRSPAG